MTEKELRESINNRIEHLRELVEELNEKAHTLRDEHDWDGETEMPEEEKEARNLFAIVSSHQDRIHELTQFSEKHEFGEHRLETKEIQGGA